MSRYHPLHSIDAILQAAAIWKEQAFGPNKSLFSKVVKSWTPQAFEDLIVCFVQNLDESDDKFWDKLHRLKFSCLKSFGFLYSFPYTPTGNPKPNGKT